jgi:hypothetical protein
MAATKVCNYSTTPGWTPRGPGSAAVTLNGRVHHFIPNADSSDPSCGLSYFIFDSIAAQAGSSFEDNVDRNILSKLREGLKSNNPYCKNLQQIGIEVRAWQTDSNRRINIMPIMPNQERHLDVCSVINCRQNNHLVLGVRATDGSDLDDIAMDTKHVEPLCFPLLLPCGHPGWTRDMKRKLTAMQYLAARLLKPEKHGSTYLTGKALHPSVKIDGRSCEPFAINEDNAIVERYKVSDVLVQPLLHVNRFQLLPRVAQYWLMDFYSRCLDARLDVIQQMNNRIMMGQIRTKKVATLSHENDELHQAGFSNPDINKKESYLPDSTHGSPRHMAALAKNALVLVSEYGCPHIFLTLTCNPKWPEIQSQLLVGQTAYDRPDIVCAVFKSRLDQFKHNIRNGKYFGGRTVVYGLHVVEYQFRGLPHVHMVLRLTNCFDIDDEDQIGLFEFVDRYFLAEMPRFAGETHQNIFPENNNDITFDIPYQEKARELVRMHNVHHCAVAINGCKKECTDKCRRGYDRTEAIPESHVHEHKSRMIYRRRNVDTDLHVVPYNLQMLMDWNSHINVEYSGSAFSALYVYKYCFKNPSKKERLILEQELDSQDEVKLFIYGRVMCSMAAFWRLYGYRDYPASEPPVVSFKVRTGAQLEDFFQRGQITDLIVYYSRPSQLYHLTYSAFWEKYNAHKCLPNYYKERPTLQNEKFFEVIIPFPTSSVSHFIYEPVNKLQRCVRIEMLYQTMGDIYYLRLILLKRPVLNDKDAHTFHPLRGGGTPIVYLNYQQSALAHGYITSFQDAILTYDDMCGIGTASLCRSYFVVLTLQGYATHAIYEIEEKRNYMMQDYIVLQGHSMEVSVQMMLRDLEHCFRRNNSSLEKFGFPTPDGVPTELEFEQAQWINEQRQKEQKQILQHMNESQPNNEEQQKAFDGIMESVLKFKTADRSSLSNHEFHFISGPGGTGKSALFKKLHAACRADGILISICAATTLAALLFHGGTTAHSLFSYPVIDDADIDDINPAECILTKQRKELLHEVLVIFWDEMVSNDRCLFEAVLKTLATTWTNPRYYIFICAGDFAQVCK